VAARPLVHHWKHGWIPLDAVAMAEKHHGRKQSGVGTALHDLGEKLTNARPLDAASVKAFPRIKGEHSLQADVVSTNPSFTWGAEYRENCVHCVNAYELRRRGYDVVATSLPENLWRQNGRSAQDALTSSWTTPSGEARKFVDTNQFGLFNRVGAWPDGARGWVVVNWKDGGSHIFSVERHNGRTTFVDPQRGTVDVDSYFDRSNKIIKLARTDDLIPGDGVTQFAAAPTSQQRLVAAKAVSDPNFLGYGLR
jgi:hypothetical protein